MNLGTNEWVAQDRAAGTVLHGMELLLALPCPPRPALPALTGLSSLQHFFTSFGARDRCFLLIFRLWQNALLEKVSLGEAWGRSWMPGVPDLGEQEEPPAFLRGHQASYGLIGPSRDSQGLVSGLTLKPSLQQEAGIGVNLSSLVPRPWGWGRSPR